MELALSKPKVHSTTRRLLECIGVMLLCSFLVYLRRPETFHRPQFWAEDATVFFIQAYKEGFSSILIPYAGYYHLVPRLTAIASQFVEVVHAPYLFNLVALLGFVWLIAEIYSDRLKLPHKALLSLLLVVAPVGVEVYMNITNIQWILAVGLVLASLKESPVSKWEAAYDVITLFLIGLTGPFSLFLFPLFILRILRERSRWSFFLALFVIGMGVVQSIYLLSESSGETFSILNYNFLVGLSHVVGYGLLGSHLRASVGSPLEWVLPVLAVLTFCLLLYVSHKRKDFALLTFLFASVLILFAAFFKYKSSPEIFRGLGNLALSRYTFLPTVFFYWAIVLTLKDRTRVLMPLLAFIVLHFALLTPDFRGPKFENLRWRKRVRCLSSGKEVCTIPINPRPWRLIIYPNQKNQGFW